MGLKPGRSAGDCETCKFPTVQVGADVPSPPFTEGSTIMLPCEVCGASPLEQMEFLDYALDAHYAGFQALLKSKIKVLYHWSPAARRKQINRYGLRPSMRPTTHIGDENYPTAEYVCLADTPGWAWSLSGGQRSAAPGEWDLWQTTTEHIANPVILPMEEANGIHEIRTAERIYKRHLWWVGSRVKP